MKVTRKLFSKNDNDQKYNKLCLLRNKIFRDDNVMNKRLSAILKNKLSGADLTVTRSTLSEFSMTKSITWSLTMITINRQVNKTDNLSNHGELSASLNWMNL